MRHLNEFDEFNPEDFEDFERDRVDLKNMGFQLPILGEDYGFGPDLKGDNDGKTPLYLTADLVRALYKKGILKSWEIPVFFPTDESFDKIDAYLEAKEGPDWKKLRSEFKDIEIHPIGSKRFGDHVQLPNNSPEKDFRVVWIGSEKESKGNTLKTYTMGGQYGFPKGWPRETSDEIPQKVIKMVYASLVELINGRL